MVEIAAADAKLYSGSYISYTATVQKLILLTVFTQTFRYLTKLMRLDLTKPSLYCKKVVYFQQPFFILLVWVTSGLEVPRV